MATDEPSRSERRFQFTLRQLFVATAVTCVLAAVFYWFNFKQGALVVTVTISLGGGLYLAAKRRFGEAFTVVAVGVVFLALLLPDVDAPPSAARRMQCGNHLKQIGLALQNYHDVYQSFPPAYVADANGKPMHSWRVLILPFAEQKPLYDAYRFDEPWDGPNNRKLHDQIPPYFCCPNCYGKQPKGETNYVAVVGPQTMWPDDKTVGMAAATDGTSNTIAVVEFVNSRIHWMEPRDLYMAQIPMAVNPTRGQGISSLHPNAALAVFVDGHTAALTNKTPPDIIRRLLTIADGEPTPDY